MANNQIFGALLMIFSATSLLAYPNNSKNYSAYSYTPNHAKIDSNQIKSLLKTGYSFLNNPLYSNSHKPDSALICFNKALKLSIDLHNDALRIKSLDGIANVGSSMGDLKKLHDAYVQIITYYHVGGNKLKEGISWSKFGDLIPGVTDSMEKLRLQCYVNSATLFKQTRNTLLLIEAQQNIARTNLHLGNIDLASQELQRVQNAYKKAGYNKLQYTYDLMGDISKLKADLRGELEERLKVVKLMQETGDTSQIETYYAKLAVVYTNLSMYAESIRELNHSIIILKRKHNLEDLYGNLSLLVLDYTESNNVMAAIDILNNTTRDYPPLSVAQQVDINEEYGNCYRNLKNYAEAEKYYLKMMQLYKITAFNKKYYTDVQWMYTDMINYYEVISNFYILTHQYQKADFFATKILKLRKDVLPPICRIEFQDMKFKIDSAKGNYIEAIKYLKANRSLSDSLFNVTKSKQISELLIKYETDKKNKDLALKSNRIELLTKQAQLQKSQVRQAKTTKNLVVLFAIMLLLLLCISYNRYRLKKHSNDLLQKKQLEINLQNASLQNLNKKQETLLDEKEWLLREVHHRVRNNLQTVVSLLNMQSAYVAHDGGLDAFRNSQRRMYAMSLIYQKSYESENMSTINMVIFINELVEYLKQSLRSENLSFDLYCEHIAMNITDAMPLALIINEAISNAIKYAFPNSRAGKIGVVFKQDGVNRYKLIIEDDGIALSESFNSDKNDSLALKLIRGLTDQLDGELLIQKTKGTRITISFKATEAV